MLIDAISATRRASEQLLQVLEDEFEALKRRDAERLVQLTTHKQTQTSATNDQFAAVQAILLQAFPAPTPAGNDLMATLRDYVEHASGPEQARIRSEWESLRTVADKVWEQNRVNGRLLELTRQSTAFVLGIMRNETPGSGVYGSDGALDGPTFSRPLAKI